MPDSNDYDLSCPHHREGLFQYQGREIESEMSLLDTEEHPASPAGCIYAESSIFGKLPGFLRAYPFCWEVQVNYQPQQLQDPPLNRKFILPQDPAECTAFRYSAPAALLDTLIMAVCLQSSPGNQDPI